MKYNCKICNKEFDKIWFYSNHLKTHVGLIKEQTNLICKLKGYGKKVQYINKKICISKKTAYFIIKNNIKLIKKYRNIFINKILKEFKNGYSIYHLSKIYEVSIKKIKKFILSKISHKTFLLISNFNKNKKISLNLKGKVSLLKGRKTIYKFECKFCKKIFETYNKNVKYCSRSCIGKQSAKTQSLIRRSKNEILFAELCKKEFKNVRCNENIFNGWDADVILDDYKLAILWNGAWHYRKCNIKHSVLQVQNRDKIKINEIIKKGYNPYIIKDDGKFNEDFVNEQFMNLKGSLAQMDRANHS